MPKTDVLLLKISVVALCLLWVAASGRVIFLFGIDFLAIVAAGAFVALAIGLWQLRPLARSFSKFLLGAFVAIDMVGTFGPFYGLDHPAAQYGSATSWSSVLLVHIPVLALAIALFGVLDRYKRCFPPASTQSGTKNSG